MKKEINYYLNEEQLQQLKQEHEKKRLQLKNDIADIIAKNEAKIMEIEQYNRQAQIVLNVLFEEDLEK